MDFGSKGAERRLTAICGVLQVNLRGGSQRGDSGAWKYRFSHMGSAGSQICMVVAGVHDPIFSFTGCARSQISMPLDVLGPRFSHCAYILFKENGAHMDIENDLYNVGFM